MHTAQVTMQCHSGLDQGCVASDHTMVQSRDASTDFYQIVTNDDTHMTIVVQLSHTEDNCHVARLSRT